MLCEMIICLLYSVLLVSNINCGKLNATVNSTGENLLEGDPVNGSAKEKHLPEESKLTVVKKIPGCIANDCKQPQDHNTDKTTTKRFNKRVKYLKTPPESLNFLVTVPSLGKKQDKRPEQISIYHLNEKGDNSDWPIEYDFEVVQPDYKLDKPLFANTEKSYPDDISIEIEDGEDKDENEDDSEDENDLENILDSQPKWSSGERKMHSTSTFPIDLSKKRYQFKNQDFGKPYVKKSTRKPPKNDIIPKINRTYKFNENSSHPVIKANRKTGHFFYGFTPDPDNEFRFVPFPVYFSAKPMRHRDKLVVPYPYFVLKTNKSDTKKDVDVELSDLNKTEIWIEGLSIPGDKGFDFLPNVELDFTDDYARLENDEDYVPSTEEDENEPFYVDSRTAVGISTESPRTSTEFRRPSNWFHPTRFPFTIVFENISTKYPDPYENGSIYVWYDCSDISNGTKIGQSTSMFPLLLLLIFHLFQT